MIRLQHIIIEGVDRLGKDTLIANLQDALGFFQVVHYQKPMDLSFYHDAVFSGESPLRRYQEASFCAMFELLSQQTVPFIMNRAHLGETVYAPRYRGYDGSYVFTLEETYSRCSDFTELTLLVTLMTSNFSFISDDGLSFDFSKKSEEQAGFIAAHHRSIITNKLLLDVHDGSGGFKDKRAILREVLDAYFQPMD